MEVSGIGSQEARGPANFSTYSMSSIMDSVISRNVAIISSSLLMNLGGITDLLDSFSKMLQTQYFILPATVNCSMI